LPLDVRRKSRDLRWDVVYNENPRHGFAAGCEAVALSPCQKSASFP
jgi:hypothetical protein